MTCSASSASHTTPSKSNSVTSGGSCSSRGLILHPQLLPAVPANMLGLPLHVHAACSQSVILLAGNATPMSWSFCSMAMLASMWGHCLWGNDMLMPQLHTPCPVVMFTWRDMRNEGLRWVMAGTSTRSWCWWPCPNWRPGLSSGIKYEVHWQSIWEMMGNLNPIWLVMRGLHRAAKWTHQYLKADFLHGIGC